ncbi:MAG: hypothetical protein ABJF88_16185 [Rhodothermales bacterium]
MRHLLLFALLATLTAPLAVGQPTSLYASADRQPIRVSMEGLYQRFSDDGEDISEFSVPLGIFLPIGNAVALSLQTNYASVSGSDVTTVSGLGDVQFVASYFQPAGTGSVVFSVGVNATTGQNALSFQEFQTSALAGQTAYDLRVPTFGQGIRVAPAVTYAFPAGDRLALGLGASYQYRGPYEPLEDLPDQYDPGEEVLLTAGAELEINPTSSFSVDLSYGINGTDTWGAITYEPGNTVTATAQYLLYLGFHEIRTVARYRARGEGDLPDASATAETAVPTQILFMTDARFQVTPTVEVGALARVRNYGESALIGDALTLFDIGLTPSAVVTEQVALTSRFVYTLGGFSGFTAGGGLRLSF